MRVNVKQPNGGIAIFDTVTDQFVSFDDEVRCCAEFYEWDYALSLAIGAEMRISESVQEAINRGLVSKVECERILHEHEEMFDP